LDEINIVIKGMIIALAYFMDILEILPKRRPHGAENF
jgi:hypothetical protein